MRAQFKHIRSSEPGLSTFKPSFIASWGGPRHLPCKHCIRGRGPFNECYSVDNSREGGDVDFDAKIDANVDIANFRLFLIQAGANRQTRINSDDDSQGTRQQLLWRILEDGTRYTPTEARKIDSSFEEEGWKLKRGRGKNTWRYFIISSVVFRLDFLFFVVLLLTVCSDATMLCLSKTRPSCPRMSWDPCEGSDFSVNKIQTSCWRKLERT